MSQRLNMVMGNLQSFVTLTILYLFWAKVYSTHEIINGFTLTEIITYYFLMRVFYNRIAAFGIDRISKDIVSGEITKDLVKPISYVFQYIIRFSVASNMWSIGNIIIISILCFYLLKNIFIQTNPFYLITFFVLFNINAILTYYLNFLIGIVAFWMTEVTHLKLIVSQAFLFLAGGIVPYSFMPESLNKILNILPFKYLVSFPALVYLGKASESEVYWGIVLCMLWILLLHTTCIFLFKFGLRSYESFG